MRGAAVRGPFENPPAEGPSFPVVGIGASAGGLEALEEFFASVPSECGMAFVVVSHQRPGHESLLPELLGRRTPIPVVQVIDGMRVEPNRTYLPPPGLPLSLERGVFRLVEVERDAHAHLPIDYFFRSLAEDCGPRAVGIVLSGSGTDGTLGLKAIKGNAGITFAQQVDSARYGGMPTSAMASGVVDFVREPGAMVEILLQYAGRVQLVPRPEPESGEVWTRILALVNTRTGVDFSHYKPGTIQRRIERRMSLHHVQALADYFRYLQGNPSETALLFQDLVIGVTSFFRDLPAFEALAEKGLPLLLDEQHAGEPLRVWVPACATGEEAYSIAFLLHEYMHRRRTRFHVQIFATDVDGQAIEAARSGFFPSGIAADVTPERLERFFLREDAGYRVRKEIRDWMIFATHNLLSDPPFSRINLLSCRNLLIYLDAPASTRLLRLFHHVLSPGGLLFLGRAESLEGAQELFTVVDGRWRLFRRADVPSPMITLPAGRRRPEALAAPTTADLERTHPLSLTALAQKLLIEHYAPTSVLIDARGEIAYVHGRTGAYLEPPPGRATHVLLEMARPGLRAALARALRDAARSHREVMRRNVLVQSNGETVRIALSVRPIREPETLRGYALVTFERQPTRVRHPRPSEPELPPEQPQEMVEELRYTKERLEHSLEELQTANEELMSSNEELTSTNEELQSTNEELESTKEEMQSLNEELQTVNAELQAKLDALAAANEDLQNLMNTTDVATIFLDNDLHIKRFTPAARKLVNLIDSDVGRPLADLVQKFSHDRVTEDARAVLATREPVEREVRSPDDTWHLLRIIPYQTQQSALGGIVLTFLDITRAKRAEEEGRRLHSGRGEV